MQSQPAPKFRELNRWMKWILYTASFLVFLAGFQLSVFTEQTDQYFAWTIKLPLTAAFLGAAYWSAVPVELFAARERLWSRARVAIPSVWLFTTLTLIVTLLHFNLFHFNSPDLIPRLAAWFWLAIYAGVPIAMLLTLLIQIRAHGEDPPRERQFPVWLRLILIIEGIGMLAVGITLLLSPSTASTFWLWTLTPLTSRAIGAWFTAIGIAAIHAIWENDFLRIRPMGAGYTIFGVLQLIAIIRYPSQISWALPTAWIYLAFIVTILPLGLYGWFGPLRMT